MRKSKGGEITRETYLNHVDDFLNDEECRPFDQMRVSKSDLDGVMLSSITLAPLSTRPTKEINQQDN